MPARKPKPQSRPPRSTARVEASASIDTATLERIGRALFGSRWQKELAEAIGMSERHMHYLAAGERPVSLERAAQLRDLVVRRRKELDVLARGLGADA
jgi:hypothetical protein